MLDGRVPSMHCHVLPNLSPLTAHNPFVPGRSLLGRFKQITPDWIVQT